MKKIYFQRLCDGWEIGFFGWILEYKKKNNPMKQTAVEWLVEMLIDNKYLIKDATHLFQQAKQMEKEQIMDAFDEGQEYKYQVFVNSAPRFFSDTYYNETYGSKGSETKQ